MHENILYVKVKSKHPFNISKAHVPKIWANPACIQSVRTSNLHINDIVYLKLGQSPKI